MRDAPAGLEPPLVQKMLDDGSSESIIGAAAGNSISVNILERCFPSILQLAKLSMPIGPKKDVWSLAVTHCLQKTMTKDSHEVLHETS